MRIIPPVAWPLMGVVLTSAATLARGDTLILGVYTSDSSYLLVGQTVRLEIRATFDRPLTFCSFEVEFEGDASGAVEQRELGPIEAEGMVILSPISQEPFFDSLPHPTDAGPLREVIFDDAFDDLPGGSADGVPPAKALLLETLTLRASAPGEWTVTLACPAGAVTQGSPDGDLFAQADVDPDAASLTFTVCDPKGDVEDDCDVDLDDYSLLADCLSGPDTPPGQQLCLDEFDYDQDGDVDVNDYAAWSNDFTGN